MSVTIDLAPDTERRLREKAAQSGRTIEEHLRQLAEESAGAAPGPAAEPSKMTPEEWVASWRAWVASHQNQKLVADDSRESIYEGRGE